MKSPYDEQSAAAKPTVFVQSAKKENRIGGKGHERKRVRKLVCKAVPIGKGRG